MHTEPLKKPTQAGVHISTSVTLPSTLYTTVSSLEVSRVSFASSFWHSSWYLHKLPSWCVFRDEWSCRGIIQPKCAVTENPCKGKKKGKRVCCGKVHPSDLIWRKKILQELHGQYLSHTLLHVLVRWYADFLLFALRSRGAGLCVKDQTEKTSYGLINYSSLCTLLSQRKLPHYVHI